MAKMVGQADPGAVLKLKACAQTLAVSASGDVNGWIPEKTEFGAWTRTKYSNRSV